MESETPDSSSGAPNSSKTDTAPKTDDVYEFKTAAANKDNNPPTSRTVSPSVDQNITDKANPKDLPQGQVIKEEKKPNPQQSGEKRLHEADEDEESRKKKVRKEETVASTATAAAASAKDAASKSARGARGGSTEKALTAKVGGAKARSLISADRKSPLSVSNSPRKPSSRDQSDSDNDDDNSKKSTDSTGLKVPPLKIVLSNQGNGNGNGVANSSSGSVMPGQNPTTNPETEQKRATSGIAASSAPSESPTTSMSDPSTSSTTSSGTVRSVYLGTMTMNYDRESRPSYTDYHVKKRKLRSQVEDMATNNSNMSNASTSSSVSITGQNLSDPCKNLPSTGAGLLNSGGAGGANRPATEPLNDIEKFLNIRRQVEQRRKNLFPVQPKPPQGFKDYLMNRKTYLLHENAPERLRSIPMIQPPPSLEGPLRDLFKSQEEERYKLRMKHLVEKEKLVLAVEQEILRVHGRAARALANQSLPYSVCTFLRDEEIYTPIDPQQEEKNRDIRSRYNGRLFLSWLQDVDDKWEKIKEQMVLRHHNEAESLNAVQKMDWEWKVKELSGVNPAHNDILPPIDDLHIPMVHVSDDFDLDRS